MFVLVYFSYRFFILVYLLIKYLYILFAFVLFLLPVCCNILWRAFQMHIGGIVNTSC